MVSPEQLISYAKAGDSIFFIRLQADTNVRQIAKNLEEARARLFNAVIVEKLQISPILILYGPNIAESTKTVCDEFGIPVYDGIDTDTLQQLASELTRRGSGTQPDNTSLTNNPEAPEEREQTVSALEYQAVLDALQDERHNWHDTEY